MKMMMVVVMIMMIKDHPLPTATIHHRYQDPQLLCHSLMLGQIRLCTTDINVVVDFILLQPLFLALAINRGEASYN